MKNIIKLNVVPGEYASLNLGIFELKFVKSYKFLTKLLSYNLKKNVFFRLGTDEFYILNRFYKNYKKLDKKSAYYSLTKNLDDDSIKLINSQLKKIDKLYSYKKFFPYIKFLNKNEEQRLRQVATSFFEKVSNPEPDVWQYNNYKLPYNHFEASVLYYTHGIDCLQNLNKITNSDIIDAGGFIGDSAIVLSDYTKGNMYSFECCSNQFNLMKRTIQLNNRSNIVPVKLGLGDNEGSTEINILDDMFSGNYVSESTNPGLKEIINITTVDKFVEENNLKVGLIKSDIEGMEQKMLQGAINTIKKYKPALIISIYHNADDYFYIKPWLESLNLGYTFKIHKPFDGSIINETCLIAEVVE